MTPEEIVERAAEVLANHARMSAVDCLCGWRNRELTGPYHPQHATQMLADAGLLPTEVQWGLRYKNLQDEWVYSTPLGVEDAEASARGAAAPGDVLLRRLVTPWEVTP